LTINEISERLNKDKKTIDKHMRILLENGLVERRYIEDERSYGYSLTRFCSNLMMAIDKAITMQGSFELDIQANTKKEVQVRKNRKTRNFILPIIFFGLAIITGYGDKIGLYASSSDASTVIAKTLGFIVFIILALFFLYIMIRGKMR